MEKSKLIVIILFSLAVGAFVQAYADYRFFSDTLLVQAYGNHGITDGAGGYYLVYPCDYCYVNRTNITVISELNNSEHDKK